MSEATWWDSMEVGKRWFVLEAFNVSDLDRPWCPLMTYWASRAVAAGIIFA